MDRLTLTDCNGFMTNSPIAVLSGTGKTGRRGIPITIGSRSGTPPFLDADDLADAAVEALTDRSHEGRTYALAGPWLMTFGDAVDDIAKASGRVVTFEPVTTERFAAGLAKQAVPAELVDFLTHLFTKVLDGRNSHLTGDLERILGRPGRDFRDYTQATAATGIWSGR